jgi:hypothetical protein
MAVFTGGVTMYSLRGTDKIEKRHMKEEEKAKKTKGREKVNNGIRKSYLASRQMVERVGRGFESRQVLFPLYMTRYNHKRKGSISIKIILIDR